MAQYATVLDIGSSKLICLVCGVDNQNNMIVRGAGIKEYGGFHDGCFADEKQFADAVVDSVAKAEMDSKCKIRELSVGVPAPFIKLMVREGRVEVSPRAKRITPAEIELIMNDSLDAEKPENCELMHSTPIEFRIDQMPDEDGKRYARAPVSNVFVDEHFRSLVTAALKRANLGADMYIAAPLAEGMFLLSEEHRQSPAVVIDVGGTFTEASVIRNGALADFRVINVGGWHFTNDLAYGLGLEPQDVENIKRRYVYSSDISDSIDVIRLRSGEAISVDREVLSIIMCARMDELSELIGGALREMGATKKRGWPVYLTGGGITLIRGACEYLEARLGTPLIVDVPWTRRLSTPNYASSFSVMNFVLGAGGVDAPVHIGEKKTNTVVDKLKDFFMK